MTSAFARLGVPTALVDTLAARGIDTPTPIQAATLPDSLAGRDVLGRGRTGSGKTYAFLLPLVARLAASRRRPVAKRPRGLILAPTRELAAQIEEALIPLADTAGLTSLTVFGGVGQTPQVRKLAQGVDVLVATPGRLLDLAGQSHVSLAEVEITVIDEADHMADMGFLPFVRKVLDQTPRKGQRMLFSATLDAGVDVLVRGYLDRPVVHQADSAESPVEAMEHHVLTVTADERGDVLVDLASAPGRAILFTRTKHGAKRLTRQLTARGIPAVELHGNLSQNARTRNLEAFGSGRVETLVATDIAARGIHVDDVALVVHADPPTEHKAYLHRSGRTARAGSAGTVITLATPDQRGDVQGLMRAAKIKPRVTAASSAILHELAPGVRRILSAAEVDALTPTVPDDVGARSGGGRGRRQQGGAGRGTESRGGGAFRGSATGAGRGSGSRPAPLAAAAGSTRGAAAFSTSAGRSTGRRRAR